MDLLSGGLEACNKSSLVVAGKWSPLLVGECLTLGLEAQNECEKLAALHPAAQGWSKEHSPEYGQPSSSPVVVLHHQHFPLRDTGSVSNGSAHS